MTVWAGIVRVSFMGDRQAGADSFHADRDQVQAVERYAATHGAEVVFMEPELSVSGGKAIHERPSLQAAIEGVENGIYQGIVVAYLSRLTRSRSGQEIWTRVEAAGGGIYCAAENLDTSTPNGRFVRDIHLANAVREREEHVDRFEQRREGATAAGIWQRRQTPLGYDRDPTTRKLVPNRDAPLVVQAFRDRAAGTPTVHIADRLKMSASGVRQLLSNRVYLGELKVGKHVNPSAHPAIVTVADFEAAQVPLARRARASFDGPALLAGLARCQACGHVMSRRRAKVVVYSCPGRHSGGRCPAPAAITGVLLDRHVEEVALHALAGQSVDLTERLERDEDARKRLADAQAELAAYLSAVSAADVGAGAFAEGARERRERVDAAHADLRRRMALAPVTAAGRDALAAWDGLDAHGRNHVLRGLIDVVIVRRGGGRGSRTPLPDRVRVIAAGAGVAPRKNGGDALGIVGLPFPDRDGDHVLRVPGG